MDNKEFGKQLEERTKLFAIQIVKLSATLPQTPEAKVIKYQLVKSGTSIGANYSEANRGRSKAEFAHKIKICESEANETRYWLEIIKEMEWLPEELNNKVLKEINELIAIFTSIGNKLKK